MTAKCYFCATDSGITLIVCLVDMMYHSHKYKSLLKYNRKSLILAVISVMFLILLVASIQIDIPGSIVARVLHENEYIEYLSEGRSSTVWISADNHGIRKIWIDNVWISSTSKEGIHELLAHYPILFHHNPRKIAGIGFGSGRTFGTCLLYPIEHIMCVEIDAEVIKACKGRFTQENYGIFNDPRSTIIIDDGRFFLSGTKEKFDIITMEPLQPFLRGTVNLYTSEFYEACKKALLPGGIFTQWLPFDMSRLEDTWSMIRTFAEAFDYVHLFQYNNDGILLGSDSLMRLDPSLSIPEKVMQNMAETGNGDIYALTGNFICSRDRLLQASTSYSVITDDKPVPEFTAPFSLGDSEVSLDIRRQFCELREPVDSLFKGIVDWERAYKFITSRRLIHDGFIEEQRGAINTAQELYLRAYRENLQDRKAVQSLFTFLRIHNRLYELPEELNYLLKPLQDKK